MAIITVERRYGLGLVPGVGGSIGVGVGTGSGADFGSQIPKAPEPGMTTIPASTLDRIKRNAVTPVLPRSVLHNDVSGAGQAALERYVAAQHATATAPTNWLKWGLIGLVVLGGGYLLYRAAR